MTIAEYENFFKADKKEYILEENKEFLKYYNQKLKNGYNSRLNIEEMQDFMEQIKIFFEFKYPNIMFIEKSYANPDEINMEKSKKIAKLLDLEQIKYRLYDKYNQFLDCKYAGYIRLYRQKKDMHDANWESIWISSDEPLNEYDLESLKESGLLKDIKDLKRPEDLLGRFKSIETTTDYKELEEVIEHRKNSIALRNKVLELIPLCMIYSKSSMPEYGYKRAKKYIEMFNEAYDLDLSTDKIEEIMNADYSNSSKTTVEEISKTTKEAPEKVKKIGGFCRRKNKQAN